MIFGAKAFIAAGLIAFGDSFTTGLGASVPANAYINKLSAYLGGTLSNNAVSGTGTTRATQNAHAVLPVNRKSAVSVLAGFNDIGAYGANAYTEIASNLRSLIACALLRENVPASAMRSGGNWTALPNAYGGRAFAIGGTPMYTNDPNAWREWDFFGETLVVGGITSFPLPYRSFNVSIDGGPPQLMQAENINPNETYSYAVLVLQNLGFAKHTVRLSVADASYWTTIDYVGTLMEPAAAQAVLIGEIPTRAVWPNGIVNQAVTDAANAAIASVVAEFAEWPVAYVPIGQFYSAADTWYMDGIHPSDMGHDKIFRAFESQLSLHY